MIAYLGEKQDRNLVIEDVILTQTFRKRGNLARFGTSDREQVERDIDAGFFQCVDQIFHPIEFLRIDRAVIVRKVFYEKMGEVMKPYRVESLPGKTLCHGIGLLLCGETGGETEICTVKTDRNAGAFLKLEMTVFDDRATEFPGGGVNCE